MVVVAAGVVAKTETGVMIEIENAAEAPSAVGAGDAVPSACVCVPVAARVPLVVTTPAPAFVRPFAYLALTNSVAPAVPEHQHPPALAVEFAVVAATADLAAVAVVAIAEATTAAAEATTALAAVALTKAADDAVAIVLPSNSLRRSRPVESAGRAVWLLATSISWGQLQQLQGGTQRHQQHGEEEHLAQWPAAGAGARAAPRRRPRRVPRRPAGGAPRSARSPLAAGGRTARSR